MAVGDPYDGGGTYKDRWIECTADELRIRWYYFPWGNKRVPYAAIRRLDRVSLGATRGRGRIWGTANPRYWANLDPGRPAKKVGFVLDLGRAVKPFVTPDEPDAFEAVVRSRAHLGPGSGGEHPAPLI
jgi:hypothetical protein